MDVIDKIAKVCRIGLRKAKGHIGIHNHVELTGEELSWEYRRNAG